VAGGAAAVPDGAVEARTTELRARIEQMWAELHAGLPS
jgi:hypothetical protein